jgi:hypothetical protein
MDDDASRVSASLTEWRRLGEELEAIAACSGATFDPATIANARELLALVCDRSPVPEIAKGYWSTFRFLWEALEFEVFADRVEIYRFCDGRTDIQHHAHKPGESFSLDLIGALPGLPG